MSSQISPEEATFIHDIAGQLAAAYGQCRILLHMLESGDLGELPPPVVEKIKSVFASLEKAASLLEKRRDEISED